MCDFSGAAGHGGPFMNKTTCKYMGVGSGSAGGIYIRINEDIVVRNVALAQNEIMTLCCLFKVVNLKQMNRAFV